MDIIALSRLVIHIRVRALPLLPTISECTAFYIVEKIAVLYFRFQKDGFGFIADETMFFRKSDPSDGSDCKGEAYLARTLSGLQTNRY